MTSNAQQTVAAGQWTISDNGQQLGPYTLDQMKQMARERRIPSNALAWTPGMTEWKPWQQVPELELLAAERQWSGGIPLQSRGAVVDYLVFRRMILPIIIQVLFWGGVLAIAGSTLELFSAAWKFADGFGEALVAFLSAALLFILGTVLWRCLCEAMILFYRINETLSEVKNAIEQQGR